MAIPGSTILEVTDLSMSFGGLKALDSINMTVKEKEIVALIGPNGAGKTTFFNCITGIYKPTAGDIILFCRNGKPERINNKKPNRITGKGMARTFQNIRLFPGMTVLENVMIGRHCRTKSGILGAVLRTPATKKEEKSVIDDCYLLLQKVGLETFINDLAGNLPYGAQRRLEIARAMATDPFLLLLDEPAAGMNPQETQELDVLIQEICKEDNIAILLIEHDMRLVMSISDKIIVMDHGSKISEGTPQQIRNDPHVIKAYLGEEEHA